MIITFYSYKGGVGRSMAIANIATLMARDYGKTVLVVDWDLEAPGLHRFFNLKDSDLKVGVIDLIYDYKKLLLSEKKISKKQLPNIMGKNKEGKYKYLIHIKPFPIYFIPAGRLDEDYAKKINYFDWQNFYDEWGGGEFINNLKRQFKEFADYTLIDSRTGITDISGICTRQLPDTVILMFASNWQNLDGIKKIAQKVKSNFEDKKINLFPVPSRVEPFSEHDKYQIWKKRFLKEFKRYIPKNVKPEKYIENISIPYVPKFSFDEYPIAVDIESGTDPKEISYAYKYLLTRIFEMESISKIQKQEAKKDIYIAEDIIIKPLIEKVKTAFPFLPSLHNQTPPEENFVGREEYLDTITKWYKDPRVQIGGLIGWGGVGKSALVRKWYDSLHDYKIKPDGIFWWGFYRNAYLEQFLNALLRYVSGGQIEPETIKSTWEKTEKIKEYLGQGTPYLIVLDGLEQMQKGESGDEFGGMIHREFTEMLHYLADAPEARGLCLITTRYPLKDLDQWETRGYENRLLIDLSAADARAILKKRGVKGSDEEMTEVVNRYKGHALSLTSTAGYLGRYYDGDIKQAPDVKFVLGDKERFKDVNKLLRKYADKMSKPERIFLNIFSLFRQEVTEDGFAGVFRKKIEGTGFNDVLVKMSKLDFREMVNGLVHWRLIWYDEMKKTYAAHPLVKGYFESDFDDKDKKLCHKHIYRYFGENAPERPGTLKQMQPLFEQVYHGCTAKLYDEVYWDVYQEKIYRRSERYLVHQLGAWETALSLVRSFFPEGELSKMPFVSKKSAQGWLLNEAGLTLLATGRPREAEEPFLTGVKMAIEAKDWKNASGGYQNLADLQFRAGRLEASLDSAKKALEMAEKAESDDNIVNSRAYLGWILHLSGKDEEAGQEFSQADELEGKISGYRLYSLGGVFYADFLLSMGRIDEAFELTGQNLEICENQHWPNSISRCHRCLGAIERTKGNLKGAENRLREALEIARRVGMPSLEIEAMIEFGRLWLDMGRKRDAIGAANEALRICERTGFKLYEGEAEVIRSKAK